MVNKKTKRFLLNNLNSFVYFHFLSNPISFLFLRSKFSLVYNTKYFLHTSNLYTLL